MSHLQKRPQYSKCEQLLRKLTQQVKVTDQTGYMIKFSFNTTDCQFQHSAASTAFAITHKNLVQTEK